MSIWSQENVVTELKYIKIRKYRYYIFLLSKIFLRASALFFSFHILIPFPNHLYYPNTIPKKINP